MPFSPTKIWSWKDIQKENPTFIALGNFDGVHLGHQHILKTLVTESARASLAPLLLTFEPHPKYYFKPSDKPSLLTTLAEKIALLKNWPIEILPLKFDETLAELEPEDFIEKFLKEKLKGEKFLLGHDHRFGKRARGNVSLLRHHIKNPDENVFIIPPFKLNEEVVSSSAIRSHLERGEVGMANELLGRPFSYHGIVVKGEGRGNKLGFPTANLDLGHAHKATLASGVYAGKVKFLGTDFKAVANIGINPTFLGENSESKIKIEVHILDFHQDIYDEVLEFSFMTRIRPEIKFPSVDALINQIHADIITTRNCIGF